MTVTATEIRNMANLPPVDVIPDDRLTVYANMAALIVLEDLSASGYTVGRLALIELNLAAHFAIKTFEYGGLTSQGVNDSFEKYQLISDKAYGLASSRFGQVAASLDTQGILSALSAPPLKAIFEVY